LIKKAQKRKEMITVHWFNVNRIKVDDNVTMSHTEQSDGLS